MNCKMPNIHKRVGSAQAYYVARVPKDVAAKAKGRRLTVAFPASGRDPATTREVTVGNHHVRVSLATNNQATAKARHSQAAAEAAKLWESVRRGPVTLTQRDTAAISKSVYDRFIALAGSNPGGERRWLDFIAWSEAARNGSVMATATVWPESLPAEFWPAELLANRLEAPGSNTVEDVLEGRYGHLAHWALAQAGLDPESGPRLTILEEIDRALAQAAEHLLRNARGDWRPDPMRDRFPALSEHDKAPSSGSITGLLEAWWVEAKATGRTKSTYVSYEATVRGFVAFLKHNDAGKVTARDVLAFKDHRLASVNPRTGRPISPKTVADSDLTALKSVFAWAVANRRMSSNPAIGITIKLGKPVRTRSKSLTDDEAKALLQAASVRVRGNERQKTFDATRWASWVMAYTGARVGEVLQLRRQDVREVGEHWVIEITPEAGTVKDKDARTVVLHEHLVELGFPAFAMAAQDGHLFLTPAKDGDVLGPLQGVVNRVGEAAREVVTDKRVAPNHGWRHRFKSILRDVGVSRDISHAITGHDNDDVGDDYGEVSLEAQARALARFPRQG